MKPIITLPVLLTTVAVIICANASAQEYEPTGTYKFVQRDTCELFLDIYNETKGSCTTFEGKDKPAILFMFGGGFVRGARDDKDYKGWFKMLNDNGYKVISIDYRLGLKGVNSVGIAQVNVLDQAIHMAVEDLFSATNFIIENAGQLGVDPYNIVISGSSAGAISVMQAEYELANRTSWAQVLPEDFNYAGVMSFAGAILSRQGKVKYAKEPAPTLMMHGTADKVVPYNQIAFFNLGFFGGGKLVDRFKKFGFNYNMFHFKNNGHEIAGAMYDTLDFQFAFLERNVILGERRIIEATVSDPRLKPSTVQSLDDIYKNQ